MRPAASSGGLPGKSTPIRGTPIPWGCSARCRGWTSPGSLGSTPSTAPPPGSPAPPPAAASRPPAGASGGGVCGGEPAVIRGGEGVSSSTRRGEPLGLVGESGCGKTTTGRCILQLERPTSGPVIFEGIDLTTLGQVELRAVRRRVQVIFQDPYSSLNPRMTVGQIIAESR